MCRFLFALLMFCGILVSAENPMNFREYTQEFVAEFTSPDEARRATAEISLLPDGQELAFTTRWDDVNKRHINMSATMKKHGIKGTFFLTEGFPGYHQQFAAKLLADGNSIGAHSLNHPALSNLRPTEISAQVMLIRPLLESQLNTSVISFVLPGCNYTNRIDSRIPGRIRDAVLRSGYYCTPEPWPNVNKTYECKTPDQFINTCYFSANDRNPTEELFFKNLERAINDTKKKGFPPLITLGTHTWQNDEGLQILGRCFARIRRNNWWFCTVNEYAAYRYEYLFSPIQKLYVDGSKVKFSVRRISPEDLGMNMPLSVLFTLRPVKVTMNGTELAVNGKNICKLPHNSSCKLPTAIDYVRNPENKALVKGVGKSAKIPGVEFGIRYDDNTRRIQCRLSNLADAVLGNIRIKVRLPLRWEQDILSAKLNRLEDEFSRTWQFNPGKESDDEGCQDGRSIILAQCDFELEGKAYRIYADTTVPGRRTAAVALGKNMVSAGPFAAEKALPDMLVRFSDPTVKLSAFGTAANEKWNYCPPRNDFHNHAAIIGPADYKIRKIAQNFCNPAKGIRVSAVDFNLDRTEELVLEYNYPASAVYLNGILLNNSRTKMRITANAGRNRLLLVETKCGTASRPVGLRLFSERQNAPVYNFVRPEF